MISVQQLNSGDEAQFVAVCGPLFEHSPWIAQRTWAKRPFADRDALHAALVATMHAAADEEKLSLIRAHPDLVGRLAREGQLTRASTAEQTAAGLATLSEAEIAAFDHYNAAYRQRFGFPFVICARENRKQVILAAFPQRLLNTPEQEMQIALAEIAKIARFRLLDAVS